MRSITELLPDSTDDVQMEMRNSQNIRPRTLPDFPKDFRIETHLLNYWESYNYNSFHFWLHMKQMAVVFSIISGQLR